MRIPVDKSIFDRFQAYHQSKLTGVFLTHNCYLDVYNFIVVYEFRNESVTIPLSIAHKMVNSKGDKYLDLVSYVKYLELKTHAKFMVKLKDTKKTPIEEALEKLDDVERRVNLIGIIVLAVFSTWIFTLLKGHI